MAASYTTSSVFKASVLGASVGILAALVLAPRSGKETRSRLRRIAQKLQEKDNPTPPIQPVEGEMDDVMTAALREEQERMRLRRENKRQMPILTNWEREL